MNDLSGRLNSVSFSRHGDSTSSRDETPSYLSTFRERLQPKILDAYTNENLASLNRRDLARHIGHMVTTELDGRNHGLNLVDQRNLVTDLLNWLELCAPPPAADATGPATAAPKSDRPAPKDPPAAAATAPAGSADAAPEQPTPKQPVVSETVQKLAPTVQSPSRAKAEEIKSRIEPTIFERMDISAASLLERAELTEQLAEIAREILDENQIRLNHQEQQDLVELLLDDMLGLGPLEPLLADEAITDIMVNGANQVYIERAGKLELTDVRFRDNSHVMNVATRIVTNVGRRVDESTPLVDARLADGSRVNIIIPPLAIDGATISIRKFAKKSITLDIMARQRNVSEDMATVLKIASRSQLNILISGGTGSGKTTLLNALSEMIDVGERIVTIEDAAELQMQQPHVVRLETRPANLEGMGEINMRDLVKNALRMRPDRIILGEVRGAEAVDMLQAMNTGHDGSLGTIHANRPREALTRLENMVGMAGINLPAKAVRTQIAAALDLIVQISRMRDGMRRVTNITEVVGMEGDIITTQDLFTFDFEGENADGSLFGTFKSSGLRPHFATKAAYFGLERALLETL
jgi:pilus assembly protein CpaF